MLAAFTMANTVKECRTTSRLAVHDLSCSSSCSSLTRLLPRLTRDILEARTRNVSGYIFIYIYTHQCLSHTQPDLSRSGCLQSPHRTPFPSAKVVDHHPRRRSMCSYRVLSYSLTRVVYSERGVSRYIFGCNVGEYSHRFGR